MEERYWEAHEQYCRELLGHGIAIDAMDNWLVCLKERKRLAALLTWRPGPPTEPGDYLIKFKSFPVLHCHCCADDLANSVGAGPLAEWHLGPLPRPEPPKAEVTG